MYSVPMNSDSKAYLHTAIEAAHAAAAIHRYYLSGVGGNLHIDTKSSDIDIVTRVDKECEAKIREIILERYPEHVVLGEEEGQNSGESAYRWVVDPLDGTVNYTHGFPFYCVSIGLEINGSIALGVVLDSVRNELFSAVRGEGSYCNGSPIHVSATRELRQALLSTGFPYDPEKIAASVEVFARMMQHCRAIRRPGAAALDLCHVACGRFDGFWERKLSPWDVAAGWLIIQEAGGTVTGPGGEPYRLEEKTMVASNGHLHAQLLEKLQLGNPSLAQP